jgi:hypothetical protein
MSRRFRFQIIQRELTFTYTRNVKTCGALNAVNRFTTTIFSHAMGLLVVQFTMTRTRTSLIAPAMADTPASPVVRRASTVNLRHAAALALVGWYLMIAPPSPDHTALVPSAPLSQWKLDGSYDTAAQCMKARSKVIERLAHDLRAVGPDGKTLDKEETRRSNETIVKCIASDDPRLKGN